MVFLILCIKNIRICVKWIQKNIWINKIIYNKKYRKVYLLLSINLFAAVSNGYSYKNFF